MELFGADFDADPYPAYAWLRANRPVYRTEVRPGLHAWLVTRYADARAALGDPRLSKDPRLAPPRWQQAGRGRPLEDRDGLGIHLQNIDPPDHTRLRRLVATAFTPRRVDALRAYVQQVADDLIDAIQPAGAAELIGEFAFPLPMTVISELLGLPRADRDDFRRWTGHVVSSVPGAPDARPRALEELKDYFESFVAAKRREPGDDLVSALIAARDGKDALTEAELLAMIFLLVIAGHETSVHLIGNGVLALLRAAAQPADMDSAVEEILRYDPPLELGTWRFTTEAIEISGTQIPPGEPVLVVLAAANRDPARFPDPDRLDINRTDNQHLAFGHGVHYCLGAGLARVEGRVALETLFRRLPDLALAVHPAQLRWRHSLFMRGLHELPVVFTPA